MSQSNTFDLPWGENGSVPVTMLLDSPITEEQLREFPAFKDWKKALEANLKLQSEDMTHPFFKDPYTLRSIEIQSVDKWREVDSTFNGFVKLKSVIKNKKDDQETEAAIENNKDPNNKKKSIPEGIPGIALLRGGSVAVLIILRPSDSPDERWVVMTEQPRIPAGSLSFLEIPAGMLDHASGFAGKAAEEIYEETSLKIPASELIDMTSLALRDSGIREDRNLQRGMYPSPGGSDEFIPIYLWEKELGRREIESLRSKLTGKRGSGEMITLRLCNYEELWREGARDAKTLGAWALYEGLGRAGIIEKKLKEIRTNM